MVVMTVGNGGSNFFFPLHKDSDGCWGYDNDCDKPGWLRRFLSLPFPHKKKTDIYQHPFFSSSDWNARKSRAQESGPEADED